MNRLIDELDQVIEDKEKSLSVYFFLLETGLMDREKLEQYNRYRNLKLKDKSGCPHDNLVTAAGLTTCYDCGFEE